MANEERVALGIIGTVISATGAGMSVTDIQAIISIIVTILGFVVSVLIPTSIKLYKKIKAAKEDKVITKEEAEDIASTVKEIVEESSKLIDEVSEKSEGDK